MPVLEIYSPFPSPPAGLLELLCTEVSKLLSLPEDLTWVFWNEVPLGNFRRSGWSESTLTAAPTVFLHCKETYTRQQVNAVMRGMQNVLASELKCDATSIFIAVRRVRPFELLAHGEIWEG